ncbi:hypothetical protein PSQ90_14955 [Devosia rhodophyticola]|uniref:Tail tape measure protein n=1 Tax=Devosia rhodophyticola TaxID=3026423 RepID=A0ABY7YW22_9HYPH|nr:hypothetical protein [Devosia rhodophyticola]WDR05556.1 hypothetical protein PSQ90_14955 [Devosia rhodophyticola]
MPTSPMSAPDAPSGHRATGGPVWAGGSFIVGDGGEEEVFTPKSSGTITPASKVGGGNITIGPFTISGGGDPMETARAVAREVESAMNRLMRGAHTDSEAWDT